MWLHAVYFLLAVVARVSLAQHRLGPSVSGARLHFSQDIVDDVECPVNVTVTDVSYKTVNVTWSAPSNVTWSAPSNVTWSAPSNVTSQNYTYMVYYGSAVLPVRPPSLGVEGRVVDVTQCLIKGLDSGTRYNIYVVTNSSDGHLSRCAPLTVQTLGYGPNHVCNCEQLGVNRSLPASQHCHYMTGQCHCVNKYTTGPRCDQCHVGYYWHVKLGCDQCHCPNDGVHGDGNCYPDENYVVRCRCLDGFTGLRCDLCDAASYADMKGYCVPCQCNGNSVAGPGQKHCNEQGVCLACGGNTTGDSCQLCMDGYHGDARYHNCSQPGVLGQPHPGPGLHTTEIITGLLAVIAVVVALTTVILLYNRCRRRHKDLPLWTVALQDNQEHVEFAVDSSLEYSSLEQHLLGAHDHTATQN